MTKGDMLYGIKTIYKGIEMRSKLETKVAMFLDALKIKWVYEPKPFLLSNGIPYLPDFYLPEDNIWIEVKGRIEEHNRKISKQFVKENNTTLIMISSNEMIWYGLWDADKSYEEFEDKNVLIGFCPKCKRHFFASQLGDWKCSKCLYHDGDHIIIGSINAKNLYEDKIDFSDIESIKGGLEKYGVAI